MCDSVDHTHFPKEDHLPDWVCQDKHVIKGDRVDANGNILNVSVSFFPILQVCHSLGTLKSQMKQ
jgi:hypothetical protein